MARATATVISTSYRLAETRPFPVPFILILILVLILNPYLDDFPWWSEQKSSGQDTVVVDDDPSGIMFLPDKNRLVH